MHQLLCWCTNGAPEEHLPREVDSYSASYDRLMGIKCRLSLVMHRFLPKFSREFTHKSATYSHNSTTYSNNSTTCCHNSMTYSRNSMTYSRNSMTEGLQVLVGAPLRTLGTPVNDLQVSRLSPKGALSALSFSFSLLHTMREGNGVFHASSPGVSPPPFPGVLPRGTKTIVC